MELKLQDAEMLKKILKTIEKFVKQVKFISEPKYFGFNCLEQTKTAYFELKIYKKSFESYKPSTNAIIVDLPYFNKVFARYKAEDTLWIKENPKKNKIDLIFENHQNRYFEISTLEEFEGIEKELAMDNTENFKATMKIKPILEVIKDIKAIEGEIIELSTEHLDTVRIKSTSEMMNDHYEYTLPETVLINKKGTLDAIAIYDLNIIESILSCGFKTAEFCWKTENPLKLHFKNDALEFNVIIAPRAEEEEDESDDFNDGDVESD